MNRENIYKKMYLIRNVEERIETLFSQGLLRGTTHGSRGQEAIAVGVLEHIDCHADYVTGGHRSHGHYLALNPDPYPFIAELMGKETGLVGGRGGSQHIAYKNFYTNGITGGMVPVANGMAFNLKKNTENNICVAFFGDGAMNEGYVMEAINLAGVFKLPILFVLENNKYAMSTDSTFSTCGEYSERIKGLGVDYVKQKALDVEDVYNLSKNIIKKIRTDRLPAFIEFETHRFSGHSKSDSRKYIPKEVDEYWLTNDPLLKLRNSLAISLVERIESNVNTSIELAIKKAKNDNYPEIK